MLTRREPTPRNGTLGFIDQALSSGSNFIVMLGVARSATVDQFGQFTIAFGIITMCLALSRVALGVPVATDAGLDPQSRHLLVARSTSVAVLIGCAGAIPLLFYGLLAGGNLALWCFLLGISLPIVIVQDLWRYVAVSVGRAGVAVLSDGLWAIAVLVTWLSHFATGKSVSVVVVLAVWAAGALVGAIVFYSTRVGTIPMTNGMLSLVREPRRRHLAGDAIVGTASSIALAALVATLASPGVTGTWRAATTLMSPINVLIGAVPLALLGRTATQTEHGALRTCVRLAAGLAVVTGLWGLMLLLLPNRYGSAFIGQSWVEAHRVLPLAIFEMIGIGIWTSAVTLMRVRNFAGRAFVIRVGYALISLLAGVGAVVLWSDARAVQGALAACALLTAALSWWLIACSGPGRPRLLAR